MNKFQRDISKDVKHLEKFFGIKYTQAKKYLRSYQEEKEGKQMKDKMCDKCKDAFKEILMNLRCIDVTGNPETDSYINDSIRIAVSMLGGSANE